MRYLHTMIRVGDLDAALDFFCAKLGLVEMNRIDNEAGRFTLVFFAAPDDRRTGAREQGADGGTHLQLGRARISAAAAISATSPIA